MSNQLAIIEKHSNNTFLFRAFAPEPIIQLKAKSGTQLFLFINNVHPEIIWQVDEGQLIESASLGNTNHMLHVKAGDSETVKLRAVFPREDGYRFAAIGDTGGESELSWCIHRAKQLDADFLLHLGDFAYSDGDYSKAVSRFHKATLPCYIAIGNHDFHYSGKIFQPYINELGVFSHRFQLHDSQFINIDTANDFFPPSAGQRGDVIKSMVSGESLGGVAPTEHFAFSHRPLKDMRPGDDHHINGVGEREWLQKVFKQVGLKYYFCGHVHHKFETDLDGVLQLNAGQGLGHEDLLANRSISEICLVQKERGLAASHTWKELQMPVEYYRNAVHINYMRRKGVDMSPILPRYPNLNI